MDTRVTKISIIGLGNVGATTAYALLLDGLADELVLYSRDKQKALGEQMDLEHGMLFLERTKITATDSLADIAGSDIVIIAAGAAQAPGETRLDLVAKNTKILEGIAPSIRQYAQDAVVLLVANPVDILTWKAAQMLGFPAGRVIGSGTLLDTARFRYHLSLIADVHPRSIHAYILGEHGDSSFPVISSASIGGQLLTTHSQYTPEKVQQAFEMARGAACAIITAKGATYYAIAVMVTQIVRAIARNTKSILPLSLPLKDYYGVSGVALSVPCIVGKNGVAQTLTIQMSEEEKQKLHASADTLKAFL